MATFFLRICILYEILHFVFSSSPFPASAYYWPMKATNNSFMLDIETHTQADLYDVAFISVSRLQHAASLRGQGLQWIDIDAGLIKDCLAFQFSSCDNDQSISIAFWIRMRNGRRVISTGSYTNSSFGPGILIYFVAETETLYVEFASSERHWSVNVILRKHSWYHVTVVWSIDHGLRVVLDGRYKNKNSKAEDTSGFSEKVFGKPYTKMMTIGRPEDMSNLKLYGDFDIAHLVIYFRSLTDLEIGILPTLAISKGTEHDLLCCTQKQNDPCYKEPCMKVECLNLEQSYTDCVCPGLDHPKCPAFPSTIAPTTSLNCAIQFELQDKLPLTGCGNNISSDGKPTCGSSFCFYGVCEYSNNIEICNCPKQCDSTIYSPVCGSDSVTYKNICTLKNSACMRQMNVSVVNIGPCESPLINATYYWPLNESIVYERENGKSFPMLHNGIQKVKTLPLGSAIRLDGIDDWIEIKDISDQCILHLECEKNGLTVSFWMNFTGGDYIFASGGYAGYPAVPYGVRLQKDHTTGFFKLEVSTKEKIWELYIPRFPKNWFHFAFTWSKESGLYLYFNAELKYFTNNSRDVEQYHINNGDLYSTIKIGIDNNRAMFGKFEIVHLAIWKQYFESLSKIYTANLMVDYETEICCYKLKVKPCDEELRLLYGSKCICPHFTLKLIEDLCKNPTSDKQVAVGCYDSLDCKVLVNNQVGFCTDDREYAASKCAASCKLCVSSMLASSGPREHFSKSTLIFSLVGCVGGLILLMCMMVYFWRVYRTRYHGAFVPPLKKVSLLDVSNDYDDKWSARYIDNSAFYIKDVPPKKRALPLIPAKVNSQRYQPPDFD